MPLARKLTRVLGLGCGELARLSDLQRNTLRINTGVNLIEEGQDVHQIFILMSGWACSYKQLSKGTRQIISFSLPGDIIGLGSMLTRTSDQSCAALTDTEVVCVDVGHMMELLVKFPRLTVAILGSASRDQAMIIEHLVNVGRRSAAERVAHCFLELGQRLQLVGLGSETEYECPLTQLDLADALGLSPIHVNRVLRHLREERLLTLKSNQVIVHSPGALKKFAGYDGGYLDRAIAA